MIEAFSMFAEVSSILSLIVTIFLYREARIIRQSFLRRARLPAINRQLTKCSGLLNKYLRSWPDEKQDVIEQFSVCIGLLGNLVNKLPSEEKTMVKAFTEMAKGKLDNLSKDSAWSLYKELSIVITHLKQLEQDAKWD